MQDLRWILVPIDDRHCLRDRLKRYLIVAPLIFPTARFIEPFALLGVEHLVVPQHRDGDGFAGGFVFGGVLLPEFDERTLLALAGMPTLGLGLLEGHWDEPYPMIITEMARRKTLMPR